MDLTNKLKTGAKGLLAAAVISSPLYLASCSNPSPGENEALLGMILMGTGIQKGNPAAAAVGRGLLDYGAAKAGRSEVNVNVNTNRSPHQEQGNGSGRKEQLPEDVTLSNGKYYPASGYEWINKGNNDLGVRKIPQVSKQNIVDENFKNSATISQGNFYFFATNYWKDFNKNGTFGPNEFVGIKKIFRDGEELMLVSYDGRSGLEGDKEELEVYSPKGNIVYTDENTYDSDKGEVFCYHGNKSTESTNETWAGKTIRGALENGTPFTDFLVKKGGYGNYKAVWTLNGKHDGSTRFEIIPSFKNKKITKK